ncbi:MAG: Fur family transcriptional regulator, partial [Verrucomicrobiota bacterium]
GLQVTSQRVAVLRAVHTLDHATADHVCESVRESIGTVSRQAVYDALNTLCERGLLHRIQPAGSPSRFEARTENHHHLICRCCGKVYDVDCAKGKAPCLHPIDDHGFIIEEAEVIYWGICPECQNKL